MNLATYAGGYNRLYQSDEQEISVVEAEGRGLSFRTPQDMSSYLRHWWPCTLDFREEARRRAARAVSVNDFAGLLRAIQAQNHLDTVLWFGHATPGGEMQFGNSGVSFGTADLPGLQNSDISQYFNSDGRIIIYGCNAGQNRDFIQNLADALRVSVCAFSRGIRWEIRWQPLTGHDRRIIYRGVFGGALPTNYTCYAPR